LLAQAMTALLDDFAPESLAGGSPTHDPTAGERLTFAVFGDSAEDPNAVLVVHASAKETSWEGSLALRDFIFFVTDIENGYTAGLSIGDDVVEIDAGAEAVEVPFGPFLARGTIEEWRNVLDRELHDLAPLSERPG